MNYGLVKMINDEIKNEIENLELLEPGSEKHSTAIDDISKLRKLSIEAEKLELDTTKYSEDIDRELKNKEDQKKKDQLDTIVKCGIVVFEVGMPLIFYGIWMRKGFKFEETGIITSSTFKGLINRFRPTKK